jgi:hypothetical protein
VLTIRGRTRKSWAERLFFLPIFRLTWASCRTSRPTITSISHSSRCMVAICEHTSSAPPPLDPSQWARGVLGGYPSNPNSSFHRAMTVGSP